MAAPFIWRHRVAFGDCDPARIAYTGRLADFALDALDAFWDDLLDGKGWYHMNVHQGFGMPFVHMEYDFTAPVRPGEILEGRVWPEAVGKSSVALIVEGWQTGRDCFAARFVSVFADLANMRKMPVPAAIRGALEARFPGLSSNAAPMTRRPDGVRPFSIAAKDRG